jgi:hypothetical protein
LLPIVEEAVQRCSRLLTEDVKTEEEGVHSKKRHGAEVRWSADGRRWVRSGSSRSIGDDEVEKFLESADLSSFAETFRENGVRMKHLADISEDELKEMGVGVGYRKTFF